MPKTELLNNIENKIKYLDEQILIQSGKITSQSKNAIAIRASSMLMMRKTIQKQVLIEIVDFVNTLKVDDFEVFYKTVSDFINSQAKEYFNLDISRVSTSDPWVSFNNSLKLFYYEHFYSELNNFIDK